MSLDTYLQNLRSLAETILFAPVGTGEFYLLLGVGLFVLLVVGKLMTVAMGGSGRGFVPVFIGEVLILLAGVGVTVLLGMLLAPHVENASMLYWAKIAGGVLAALVVIILVSRMLLGVPPGVGIVVMLLTLASAYAAVWASDSLLNTTASGETRLQQIQEEVDR